MAMLWYQYNPKKAQKHPPKKIPNTQKEKTWLKPAVDTLEHQDYV
jgi:hypothetical protein